MIAMRKKSRALPDAELDALLRQGRSLTLAMIDAGRPYAVPLNYGYEAVPGTPGRLWLHCATEGRKVTALAANPRVAFSIVTAQEVVTTDRPCGWTCHYTSLYGEGLASLLTEPEAKAAGLATFMAHYGVAGATFPAEILAKTLVVRIDIQELSGKRNPTPKN